MVATAHFFNIKTRSLLALCFALCSCATYQTKIRDARNHLEQHVPDKAIGVLAPLANKPSDDQLVYLFDYATALQIAGQYKASSDIYLQADKVGESKDYLSVSRFGGSLLLGEEFTQYKGDDYEKLLIHVMSALNFVMLHDRESALVEVRRLNEKLEYFRIEEKKEYDKNTMAMYLSAMLWEADRNWDSAYIDYERAYKRDPNIPLLKEDLVRAARRAGRNDMYEKWSKLFGIRPRPEWSDKNMGEIVLIYQQGWGPRKIERPRVVTQYGFISPGFPALSPVPAYTKKARLQIASPQISAETQFVYSVEEAAIKALEAEYAPLIAKRIAGYIAKEAMGRQIGKKNEALGVVASLAMHISDRADLRQWSTLPSSFQVARIYLPAGQYNIRVQGLSEAGQESGEAMPERLIEVRPRETQFISWRSFR